MSQAQDLFPEPAPFRDALEVLTEAERSQAERLITEGEEASSLPETALVLAGAFLLYREYMRRRLARGVTPTVTRTALRAMADFHWRGFLPTWVLVTTGALSGAARGGIEASTGEVPDELLLALGEDYAERLGPYLHDSSTEALIEGFTQHVNKRVPRKLAADRAVASIGLSTRQTRALNAMKTPPPVNSVRELNPDAKSDQFIERALVERARMVGDQESFSASQEGRQLGWMYQISKGTLSASAERMWVTARDERVCKTCGPMHRVTVPITEPFETPIGRMWAPAMHPNCRCEIKLKKSIDRDRIKKNLFGPDLADFNEEHPRLGDGRFRTKTEEKTETEVGTRVGGRIGGRVDQRLGGRIGGRIEQRLDQRVSADTVAPSRVEAPALNLSRVEAARLVERLVETPVIAKPVVQAPVKTQSKTKTVYTNIYKLPHDVFYVAEDEGDHGYDGKYRFSGQAFGKYEDLNDDIHNFYSDMIDNEAEGIVDSGRNVVEFGVAETGEVHQIQLDQDQVRAALEAELFGLPDEPLRHAAHQLGFDRYEVALNVFVLNAINTDESEGDVNAYQDNDWWEIQGSYEETERGFISDQGVPVRFIFVEPEGGYEEELD